MSSSELKSPENKTVFNQDEGDVVQTNRKGAKKGEATKEGSYNLKPVRVYGHPNPNVTTGDSKSVIEVGNRKMQEDVRASNTAGTDTKTCYFYKDRDYNFPGIKIAINPRKYKKFDTLLQELSRKVPGLGFGVRGVFTPRGNDKVSNLDGLTHFGQYVCTDINRRRVRGLDLRAVGPKPKWSTTRPPSGRRILNNLLKEDMDSTESPYTKAKKRYDMSTYYEKLPPKKITVLKNGDPTQRHILLLNRHTGQSYEQILESLCEMFHSPAHKLCTTTGAKVSSLSAMFRGPNTLVCCGKERFVPMDGQKGYLNPGSRVMSRVSLRSDVVSQRMKIRRNRLVNTKGNWKVSVQTNGHSSASTQAQVSITVYGYKGNSGPITLGSGDGTHFQSGNIDEFEINVGNVGEIYKIRISHDNAGDSPGWLCDEVRMKDLDTNEELVFTCRRWLARDEDDGEICREMPAVRKGEPIHSVVRYNVYVTTGNLWNASTDANVYMTMYGDRGDTGVRQLYSSNRSSLFNQGKTDTFTVEAVSLGHLKRIIVGHDGTGPGLGWFLEKIVVKEPNSKAHEENVFYCGKWLDEGEDDGKIVRELKVQDEYMDDILEKRNWEHEKWKFEKNSQVKLYSLASGKAVRGKANGSLDALGGDMDMSALFTVHMKKPMVRMFSSVSNPNAYLTMDNGKMSVNGKGGPFCDFRLRVQGDRSIMFEAVKNPLQFLTFGENGHPEDVRGILDKEKTRRFFVYCKGMFRHRGLIIFCSSMVQTISVNPDLTMTALGKKAKMAQFRVHKVSSGVRMFESLAHPGKYIRMKDGKIDCEGERNEFSHFLVERKKPGGYISLQSSKQRGLYLGMKPDGRVWPTVDTGVNNIYLYPEVLEWGTPKLTEQEIIEEEADEEMFASPRKEKSPEILETKPDTPVKRDSPAQPSVAEGEWGIEVSTQEELQNAKVFIVVYGDKGNSGAIALGGPPGKSIFESGNNDQFKANLLKCGKIYKIRLELEPTSLSLEPIWKVKQVLLTDLAKDDKLTFTFNRWLSRQHEDKEIMRELPAIWENEDPLPLMKYHVMVHTGEEDGSETDATIYLNIYGEKGDTGKRVLLHSNNTQKFRSGQVDLFEVEAVCLGTLQKCVVGHDKLEAGKGWYLTQIVIRESEDAKEEYVFPCNQWLDGGQGDQKIERTLAVKGR